MNDDPSKRRLGRGLAALIGEIESPEPARARPIGADRRAPIESLRPNPRNPRRQFVESDLDDLAQSIRTHGVVQPVVVRPAARQGEYEIIAGERRWRASQRAGLADIPIIVREVDDRLALELAIVENVQRADLNPVEEARGYEQLIADHDYTQADLAGVIGKSRSHVANTLRLLKLPPVIHDLMLDGSLSAGHARTLVTASNPAELARRIIEDGLSVRQAEALAQAPLQSAAGPASKGGGRAAPAGRDADTEALEKLLSDVTGMRVAVVHKGKGGELRVAYQSLEQLDELCRRLQS